MNRLLRGATLLCLAATAFGCAATRAPLTCPEEGGPQWTEVISKHFVLRTDVDPPEARALSSRFEELHAALAYVLKRPAHGSPVKVEVIYFERPVDFYEFAGKSRTKGAYFDVKAPRDIEAQPLLVMHDGDLLEDAQETVLHELSHRFLHERFSKLPPWLDEGVAGYYSTLKLKEGRIVLGAPGDLDFSDRPYFWQSWQGNSYQTQIPLHMSPTLWQLMEAGRDSFYLAAEEEDVTDDDRAKQLAHYGASWKLVHYFLNGPDSTQRERFAAFLAALEGGARPRDAFLETFGRGLQELKEAYKRYLGEARLRRLSIAAPPMQAGVPEAERRLSDAEVHLLWARLLPRGNENEEKVQRHLDEALARDEKSPDVQYQRALFLLVDKGRFDEARKALDRALAARPDDPRFLYASYVWYQAQIELGLVKKDKNFIPSELVERLARRANSAHQMSAAARLVALRGRLDESLRLSERSIAADPLCWSCEELHALILADLGHFEQALTAIDRALAILPEHQSSRDLMRIRKKLERDDRKH